MSYFIDVGEQDKALAKQIAAGPGDARRAPPDDRGHARPGPTTCARRRPPRSARSTRAWPSSRRPRPSSRSSRSETAAALAKQKRDLRRASQRNKAAAKRRWPRPRPPRRSSQGQIAELIRKQIAGRQHPVASTTARCAGRWRGDVTQNFGCTGFAWEPPRRRLRALPQRHRHRRAVRHAGPGVGRRDGRLHRLELRRRRRPGLDRDHRPQRRPPDLVRPHAAALPGRDPRRQPGQARARSSATRATPATRPARTSTGWSMLNGDFVNPRLFL